MLIKYEKLFKKTEEEIKASEGILTKQKNY
jgi:hypothetical protein